MGQLKDFKVGKMREGDENGNTNFVCTKRDVCPKHHCPRGHHLRYEERPLANSGFAEPAEREDAYHEDGKTWIQCWKKENGEWI